MSAASLLVEARRRAGISQRELARRIGTSQPAIARWEAGTVEPGFGRVVAALQSVGLDLAGGLVVRDDSDDALIARRLRMSPASRVDALVGMLRGEAQLAAARRVRR